MNGKGIFIHKGSSCYDGSLDKTLKAIRTMGLSWVALKIADGGDTGYASYPDMLAAVSAFRGIGLDVWGWHYVYGGVSYRDNQFLTNTSKPEVEANLAKTQTQRLKLSGYIIDAEKEWKGLDQAERALRFGNALSGIGVPVAFCSYRFPRLHPEIPWHEFLSFSDLHMPQVYWQPPMFGRGPMPELETSIRELTEIKPLPVVPVGRAYIGDGHPNPTGEEITQFLTTARGNQCTGASFWVLDHISKYDGSHGWAAAIGNFVWPIIKQQPKSWRVAITEWARTQGYRGPDPE